MNGKPHSITSSAEARQQCRKRLAWRRKRQNADWLCKVLWSLYGPSCETSGIELLTAGCDLRADYPMLIAQLDPDWKRLRNWRIDDVLGAEGQRSPGKCLRRICCGTLSPFIESPQTRSEQAALSASPSRLFDGITYALGGARWDRRKKAITELRFFCGSYFDMLDTCDCMENELLDCAAQYENRLPPETSGRELLSRLPLRRRWHKLYEKARPDAEKSPYEILLSGEGRSAAAAITTMVVFEDARGRKRFFLGKRSGKGVAIQPGLNDLMPGGMFQPDANARPLQAVLPADWQENPLAEIDPAKFEEAAKKDFSIVRNVVREFAEELFDLSPAARGPAAGACDFDWYERAEVGQAKPAKALLEMLKDPRGGAELAVTGVAWNLLNTRPDICTILCIKDGSWFETFKDMITVNREWSPTAGKTAGAAAWHVALGELGSSGYDEDAVLEALGELIGPENIAPVGAAAFWLGLRWLRDNRYL